MKIFVIYKYEDHNQVVEKIKAIKSKCASAEILLLTSYKRHWKNEAAGKIKKADFALFFVGKNAHKSENIDWEIKKFRHLNKKILTIKLSDYCTYNDSLYRKELYGNTNYKGDSMLISSEVTIDRLIEMINNKFELDIDGALETDISDNDEFLIEQYKMYLQTSEDVVERRQSVSNFYISINSTIITIFATLITIISTLNPDNMGFIMIAIALIFFSLGIFMCINWIKVLDSYGKLNSAKMAVISRLEKKLAAKIYDTEWMVQNDKIGSKKYTSFTNIEKKVPKIFIILYVALLIVSIVIICI